MVNRGSYNLEENEKDNDDTEKAVSNYKQQKNYDLSTKSHPSPPSAIISKNNTSCKSENIIDPSSSSSSSSPAAATTTQMVRSSAATIFKSESIATSPIKSSFTFPKINSNSSTTTASLHCSLPLDRIRPFLNSCLLFSETTTNTKTIVNNEECMCLYCDKSFTNFNLRQNHIYDSHSIIKPNRRATRERRKQQNLLSNTPCLYCDKFTTLEHTLNELFHHLIDEHSTKYFGCLQCEERFFTSVYLADHNNLKHINDEQKINNIKLETSSSTVSRDVVITAPPQFEETVVVEIGPKPLKVTRSKVKLKTDTDLCDEKNKNNKDKKNGATPKKMAAKPKRTNKRTQIDTTSKKEVKRKDKKLTSQTNNNNNKSTTEALSGGGGSNSTNKQTAEKMKPPPPPPPPSSSSSSCVNPYPEFDHFYRVKKITDHSIDNLKISSLTFDDVFDKAFFNRMMCNIEENLSHYIDGKLFKNEESENRISNFEKVSSLPLEIPTMENYGCDLTLNALTPVAAAALSSLNPQFGEDFESQIEYGAKPSKKKPPTIKTDEIHYKYFTRRKYQASILQQKENRDLSKLDMWTQMVVKDRQEQIANNNKTPKEIEEYISSQEYKNKMTRDELNRILDRRGPFEDLKEEASKKAAFDKLNLSVNGVVINEQDFSYVRELINEMVNRVFELETLNEGHPLKKQTRNNSNNKESDYREIPSYLNLRRKDSSTQDEEIDQSDRIALICSSQETENFELPTNPTRDKNELVELTGEWARSKMYICAACGSKFANMKYLLDHKNTYHQNVWVQHYEFVGNQSELYRHLSIPGLGKIGVIEQTVMTKHWKRSVSRLCTKCLKQCHSLGELHRHVLECAGDWSWMVARKKCKYKPFGTKSRRKRKGLIQRSPNKQKTETPEKKPPSPCKRSVETSPRQKPSDAETIERMLANLPAKRSRRCLISLRDVVFKTRKSNKRTTSTIINDTEATNNNKTSNVIENIDQDPKTSTAIIPKKIARNKSKIKTKKCVRSLNKVISTKRRRRRRRGILDSTLVIKRKRKITSTKSTSKATTVTSKKGKTKQEIEKKQLSENSVKKRNMLTNHLNIKSYFPVRKRKIGKILSKENQCTNTTNPEHTKMKTLLENNINNSNYQSNFQYLKKNKKGGLKGFVRALSTRKQNSREKDMVSAVYLNNEKIEEKIEIVETTKATPKRRKLPNNLINNNKIKKNKNDTTLSDVPIKQQPQQQQQQQPLTESKNSPRGNQGQPFLEETIQQLMPSKNIVSPAEVRENGQTKQDHVPIALISVCDTKENPLIPENIFNFTTNEEKNLQAKGNLNFENFTTIIPEKAAMTVKNPIVIQTIEEKTKILPEIKIDSAPLDIPPTQPPQPLLNTINSNKSKMKKPKRLNDCIAMLTSKLQQKEDNKLSSPRESSSSETQQNKIRLENISPAPSSSSVASTSSTSLKNDCILKIPNFRKSPATSPGIPTETALDLSKKSPTNEKNVQQPNLVVPPVQKVEENNLSKVIEGIIEYKCKELLNEKFITQWPSLDFLNANNSTKKNSNQLKLVTRTNVDDTIDFVINSSNDWYEKCEKNNKKLRKKKHDDDNLIKDIIFGKDKLLIAPSSNLKHSTLFAKIKENESKLNQEKIQFENNFIKPQHNLLDFQFNKKLQEINLCQINATKSIENLHIHSDIDKNIIEEEEDDDDEEIPTPLECCQVVLITSEDEEENNKIILNKESPIVQNSLTEKENVDLPDKNQENNECLTAKINPVLENHPLKNTDILKEIIPENKVETVAETTAIHTDVTVEPPPDEVDGKKDEPDFKCNGEEIAEPSDNILSPTPPASPQKPKAPVKRSRKKRKAPNKSVKMNSAELKSDTASLATKIEEISPSSNNNNDNKSELEIVQSSNSLPKNERARRKSKNSKKLENVENGLFKDFSLVINKKTKRIPPNKIVDDTLVNDEKLDLIVKSSSVAASIINEQPTVAELADDIDLLAEIDMEIEDIPINSNIIERIDNEDVVEVNKQQINESRKVKTENGILIENKSDNKDVECIELKSADENINKKVNKTRKRRTKKQTIKRNNLKQSKLEKNSANKNIPPENHKIEKTESVIEEKPFEENLIEKITVTENLNETKLIEEKLMEKNLIKINPLTDQIIEENLTEEKPVEILTEFLHKTNGNLINSLPPSSEVHNSNEILSVEEKVFSSEEKHVSVDLDRIENIDEHLEEYEKYEKLKEEELLEEESEIKTKENVINEIIQEEVKKDKEDKVTNTKKLVKKKRKKKITQQTEKSKSITTINSENNTTEGSTKKTEEIVENQEDNNIITDLPKTDNMVTNLIDIGKSELSFALTATPKKRGRKPKRLNGSIPEDRSSTSTPSPPKEESGKLRRTRKIISYNEDDLEKNCMEKALVESQLLKEKYSKGIVENSVVLKNDEQTDNTKEQLIGNSSTVSEENNLTIKPIESIIETKIAAVIESPPIEKENYKNDELSTEKSRLLTEEFFPLQENNNTNTSDSWLKNDKKIKTLSKGKIMKKRKNNFKKLQKKLVLENLEKSPPIIDNENTLFASSKKASVPLENSNDDLNKSLDFSLLKNVFETNSNSNKNNPLTDIIINSSEMDITPVLDEIDKSLEAGNDEIYDFIKKDEEFTPKLNSNKIKKKNKQIISQNRIRSRTAKVKALENIHELELDETNKIHNKSIIEQQEKNNEEKIFDGKKFDLSIINSHSTPIKTTPDREFHDHKSNDSHQQKIKRKSLTQDKGELRRSRRGSRKVTSYNENDLIDPLIDALENRRYHSNMIKKDRLVDDKNLKKTNENLVAESNIKMPMENHLFTPLEFNLMINDDKIKDIDKIYEFTEESNGSTEEIRELFNKNKKRNVIDRPVDVSIPNDMQIDKKTEEKDQQQQEPELEKSNYCEICKKSFIRIENLIKHKTTLTHISKLSELEAKAAEEEREKMKLTTENIEETNSISKQIEEQEIPPPPPPPLEEIEPETSINICEEEEEEEEDSKEIMKPTSLNLVDIISDVLNKPPTTVLNNFIPEKCNYSESPPPSPLLQPQPPPPQPMVPPLIINDAPYKSLAERKSFDSDNPIIIHDDDTTTTTPPSFLPSTISKTTLLENQINLLENIIGTKMENEKKPDIEEEDEEIRHTFHSDDDENHDDDDDDDDDDDNIASSRSSFNSINSVNNSSIISNGSTSFNLSTEQIDHDDSFIKPSQQYEEISDDSVIITHEDSSKQIRKTLNRDEELFLECCSLLKSGSEISNSNYPKKSSNCRLDCANSKWIQSSNTMMQRPQDIAHEYSDNSRTPTPLGDTFDDNASNSNTISSNWNLTSEKSLTENRNLSFEQVISKEENDSAVEMSFGEMLTQGLKNQFTDCSAKIENRSSYAPCDEKKDDSDSSTTSNNKKIITKGARKVFEGLKIAIPTTERLNADILNQNESTIKDLDDFDESNQNPPISINEESVTVLTPTRLKSTRKSKPVKKSQNGNNLFFKVNKKQLFSKSPIYNVENEQENDADETGTLTEETANNIDLFETLKDDDDNVVKTNGIISDNESVDYTDSNGADAKSLSTVSSFSTFSLKKPEPTPMENITKKKCMIMGKIFKNAAKSKIDDESDNELRHIPEIPEMDNLEMVENYVRNCRQVSNPLPPPPPPVIPPNDETPKKTKMTEEEMNILFDKLLGKKTEESPPRRSPSLRSLSPSPSPSPPPTPPPIKSKIKVQLGRPRKYHVKKNNNKTNGEVKRRIGRPKNSKKRQRNESESSEDEFGLNQKIKPRKRYKKRKNDDSGINLELELKECIGVASRKSQRKCTSGKQNVLTEYWSSDEEAFEAMLEGHRIQREQEMLEKNKKSTTSKNNEHRLKESLNTAFLKPKQLPATTYKKKLKAIKKCSKISSSIKQSQSRHIRMPGGAVRFTTIGRRKRAAANPLYHWSSSSEDESQSLIEVKPIREEDDDDDYDDDRPMQHGWIVGDSPKKLVTMLALTKGKKNDILSVKEQNKRVSNIS